MKYVFQTLAALNAILFIANVALFVAFLNPISILAGAVSAGACWVMLLCADEYA